MHLLDFVAGSIAGAVGVAVGYPLDTVKVRLQTQSARAGMLACVSTTYAREGLRGFFKGMTFPLLSTGLVTSIAFGSYGAALDFLTGSRLSKPCEAGAARVFAAGSFAGLTQLCVSIPVDLVKVRLQGQTAAGRYRGSVHCVAEILRAEGPRGLFRGGVALAARDALSYGFYFLPYELIQDALTETGRQPGSFAILTAGGVAGVLSWALATPMDVVKARLQMSDAGGRKYGGVLDCVATSAREEGARVFFKGLALNSARAFPVNAVTFLAYERLKELFFPG